MNNMNQDYEDSQQDMMSHESKLTDVQQLLSVKQKSHKTTIGCL